MKRKLLIAALIMLLPAIGLAQWSLGDARHSESLTGITAVTGFTAGYLTSGGAPMKNAICTVETASAIIEYDGSTPQTTAGGGHGHLLTAGQGALIPGVQNCINFKAINAVGGNGAIVRCTYFY